MKQIAIVLLALVVLGGAFLSVRQRPVDQEARVLEGVTLEGKAIAGFTEAELTAYIESVMTKYAVAPVQPRIDTRTKGVIPGLAGSRVDLAATLVKCMNATKNQAVSLVFAPELPEPTPLDKPIYQGNPGKEQISFVVNVAWGNDELLQILDIFDKHELKMTFFLVGRWAAKFPDLVKEIHKRGHEFGNHAYSDPHLPKLTDEKIREEIQRTTAAIRSAIGEDVAVSYFSPPYNDFDDRVVRIAAELGYKTVICSLDTADWMRPGVDRIVRRIVPNAHNGAIVLMHPTEQTPGALEEMIPALKGQGYELVTIGEILSPIQ